MLPPALPFCAAPELAPALPPTKSTRSVAPCKTLNETPVIAPPGTTHAKEFTPAFPPSPPLIVNASSNTPVHADGDV